MGSIRKRGAGYEARYRDPNGRSRSRSFGTKAEARTFLVTVEGEKHRGTWTDPRFGKMPFCKWADECMSGRHNLRSASRARDESLLRNHVISTFGQVPLARIRKAHIQKWIAGLKDKGYSPRTIQECYRILGGIMAEAVDQKLIPESPCRRISLPRTERVGQRFLSPLEVEQLVRAFDPYH